MASKHTRALPGDCAVASPTLASMLRVNHAGEYGAQRIYAGQLAVLGKQPIGDELRHMAAQEDVHLAAFNKLLPEHGVRPTALLPFWHIAGYALGVASALMGEKSAMATTVAVESVITEHYDEQLHSGGLHEAGLQETVQKFRDEEMEHHDTGLAHEAQKAALYPLLTTAIRGICRGAIFLSKRI